MSGPKDYVPAKRYSLSVFDGKLNTVFKLQVNLSDIYEELKCLKFSDNKLNIHFDCAQEVESLKTSIERANKPMIFDIKGKFGQETYNRLQKTIDKRINELRKCISECADAKKVFKEKELDYNTYCTYLQFDSSSRNAFKIFKEQVVENLKNNVESIEPELFKNVKEIIECVSYNLKPDAFAFGFSSTVHSKKNRIIDHVKAIESEINKKRSEISDVIYDKLYNSEKINSSVIKEDSPTELNNIRQKINILISNCEDDQSIVSYKEMFTKLTESQAMKDEFFYKQLHDQIKDMERNRKLKDIIGKLIIDLNSMSLHESLTDQHTSIVSRAVSMLENQRIRENDIQDIRIQLQNLKDKSDQIISDIAIEKKERLFVKSQILLSLENRGYEVMEDMEVVDFEKDNDFLLKINGQDNYLNLMFKEDGSLRYVFQIPENKEDLGTDRLNAKLNDMLVTCSDFHAVIDDLSKMGLQMHIRSEKPIEASSIISVTKKHRNKLSKQKSNTTNQPIKKKYLNN